MSKVVDERVVVLNFDNKKFEKNSKQTIKTLDELKQSMDFSEVSDSMDKAYKSADPSRLEKSLDTVSKKFTAMEVIAFTVINRITNKMMDMGERFVKALSIDNVTAGWAGYEEEVKSVGTLLGQGYKESVVTKQLELLSKYTDATSYSYTDMANNISKFTAAGVDLEKSTQAMMGIANWAAVSGQNAQKASSAMYQLAQAIGSGTVKLQDWKSIQNVSMDTQEFREQVLETAVAMKTLKKNADGTYKTLSGKSFSRNQFTTQLSEGWFTSDVLVTTLEKYSAAVTEIFDKQKELGENATVEDAVRAYKNEIDEKERLVREFGDVTGETTKRIEEMRFALKSFTAAQEARTFTDAINATKDAVKSSWRTTFTNIFGGYEEAKETWSQLANDLWDIFASSGMERNNLLTLWGGKNLVKNGAKDIAKNMINGYVEELGANGSLSLQQWKDFSVFTGATDEMKKKLIELAKESDALYETEDGILHAVDGTVVSLENFDESLTSGWLTAKSLEKVMTEIENQSLNGRADLFGAKVYEGDKYIASASGALWNLLEAIKAVRDTVKAAWQEVFGKASAEGLKSITKRIQEFTVKLVPAEGIFERMKDILKGVFSVGKLIVKLVNGVFIAIKPIFSVFTKGGNSVIDLVQKIAVSFTDWVDQTKVFEDAGRKVAVVTEKVASVLRFLIQKVFELAADALPVLQKILHAVGQVIKNIFITLGRLVVKIYEFTKNLIIAIRESEAFQNALDIIKSVAINVWNRIKNLWQGIKNFFENIGKTKIAEVIRSGCKKIGDAFTNMVNRIKKTKADDENQNGGYKFLDTLKEKLKVLTPIFEGLKNLWQGIKNLFGPLVKLIGAALTALGNFFTAVGERIEGFLQGKNGLISFSELLKTIFKVGLTAILAKWVTAILTSITKIVDGFSMFLSGMKGHSLLERTALAMKQFAEAMLMFTAAILILSKLNTDQVTKASAAIILILGVYSAFILSIGKLFTYSRSTFEGTKFLFYKKGKSSSASPTGAMNAIGTLLLSMSASMLIISVAIKTLSKINYDEMDNALTALTVVMTLFSFFLHEMKNFISSNGKMQAPKLLSFIGMAIFVKSMAKVMIDLSALDEQSILKGSSAVLAISIAMSTILKALAKLSGTMTSSSNKLKENKGVLKETSKSGSMLMMIGVLLSISTLFSKMTAIFQDISKMGWSDFAKGASGLAIMVASLISVLSVIKTLDKTESKNAKKTVGVLISLTLVFAVLTGLIKVFSTMPENEFKQAMKSIALTASIIGAVMVVLKLIGTLGNSKAVAGATDAKQITKSKKKIAGIFAACIGIAVLIASVTRSIFLIMQAIHNENDMMKFTKIIGSIVIAIVGIFMSLALLAKSVKDSRHFTSEILSVSVLLIALESFISVVAITLAIVSLIAKDGNISVAVQTLCTVLILLFTSLVAMVFISKKLDNAKVGKLLAITTSLIAIITVLAIVMSILNGTNIKDGVKNLLLMTLAVGALGALMVLLAPMSGKILLVAAAFLMLGVSILSLATALKLLVDSAERLSTLDLNPDKIHENLTALSKVAEEIGGILATVLASFLSGAFVKIVEFIEKVLTYIGSIALKVGMVIADLLGGVILELQRNGAVDAFVDIILQMIKRIIVRLPEITAALLDALIKLIDVFRSRLPQLLNKAVELVYDLVFGLIDAFSESLSKQADRMKQSIAKFFKGLWDLICAMFGVHSPSTKFEWLGKNMILGLRNGLKSQFVSVTKWFTDAGKWMMEVWKKMFNMHSPSKLFEQYGNYMVEGLAIGLDDTKDVADSIVRLANTVTDEVESSGISDVMSNIMDAVNTDIDDDIVIKPVLDLSNIQNGATKIGSMMNGYSIGVRASGLTSDISSSTSKLKDGVNRQPQNQITNTNNENIYNTFNITGTNAKDIADEVSKELQKQVSRRNKVWA